MNEENVELKKEEKHEESIEKVDLEEEPKKAFLDEGQKEQSHDILEEIELQNGEHYLIIDRIVFNKISYVLLVNAADNKYDTFLQKEVVVDNQLHLQPIETEEELNEVMVRFAQKDISP